MTQDRESAAGRAVEESVAHAFGRASKPKVMKDALPLKRGDYEATAIWAATETAKTKTEDLRTLIMRVERCNIYQAEARAQAVAEEAYAAAARKFHLESERQEFVVRSLDALSQAISKPKSR